MECNKDEAAGAKANAESKLEKLPFRRRQVPAQAGGSSSASAPQQTPESRKRRAETPVPPTFWTVCSACGIYFEYDRKLYFGRHLLCQECNTPFLANDVGMPKFSGSGPVPWKRKSQRNVATANSGSAE